MRKIQALVMTLAMGATLAVSASALTFTPQNTAEACCDVKDCCKAGDKNMSCCKSKNGAACCCKGGSCPMPNKK